MKEKVSKLIKNYSGEIVLVVAVILISLFSFALGYIVAKQELKKPIKIENASSNYWSWNSWALFGPKIS